MEDQSDSPGRDSPPAKRQKTSESEDHGFYSFNRNSPELDLFKKYYKVRAYF